MGNIHVLPTEKPSRLFKHNNYFFIDKEFYESTLRVISQNIYITSDEGIKEGDWVFDIFKNACPAIRQLTTEEEVLGVQKTELKIILTTDPELIKDGVQAIDDEFLEWLIQKNITTKHLTKKAMATTIRNEKLFCLNCGGDFAINYPLPVDEMSKKMKAFDDLHKDCKPTWTEPKADQSKDVKEKAMWWIANGHVGMSSKTMWNCLIGNKDFPVNHPYDPDDFSRCYKLLQAVPEWKNELQKLKPLSKAWSNLVDNWDKLTEMYEQNTKEQWKNSKKIGMYELMETLIR